MKNTIELVTIEDFRNEIQPILNELNDIKSYLNTVAPKMYYRNKDLKKIYGLSDNTIKDYRDKNIIPYTFIGTIPYYPILEFNKILEQNSNFDLVKKSFRQ
jgi:hypothetical protein